MHEAPGRRALALIDRLLAERPGKVGPDFSEATRCLTAFRDELRQAWRQSRSQPDYARLKIVNQVLSVVVGGHFPIGDIPWEHIATARERLREAVGSPEVTAARP